MRQGCEQVFIGIGRGNKAEDVLRASRVQSPSFLRPSGRGGHGPDTKALLCSGSVCRYTPWAGRRITIFL